MADFKFELTPDFQRIKCVYAPSEREYNKLRNGFKLYRKNAFMSPAVRHGFADGRTSFFDGPYLPIGLWGELVNYMNMRGLNAEIAGLKVFLNEDLSQEDVNEFIDNLFEGTEIKDIRWYQYESIYRILKYRYSSQQISTAAGKTMISFAVAAYLKSTGVVHKDSKFLMIVPRSTLSSQTYEKFIRYNNGTVQMNCTYFGDGKKYDESEWDNADVIISTYQTLSTIQEHKFTTIKVINVDEAHTAKTASIKRVIKLSSPLKYRFGLSGTLMVNMNNAEYYENLTQLGPVVFVYNPKDLIDDGFAPNVSIRKVMLYYTGGIKETELYKEYMTFRQQEDYFIKNHMKGSDECLKFYKDLYAMEKRMICSDMIRMDAIIDYLSKIDKSKNILVLFNDIKGEYGKNLCERMNAFKTTKYIDGSTKGIDRNATMEEIEDTGVNLVASFGTFSTGIDLKNIHYIVFAESYKSPVLIGQSIGRGLRSHKSKKEIEIIDFVDEAYKHTVKQSEKRDTIYRKDGYPIKIDRIDL